jgi:hypothetical protein
MAATKSQGQWLTLFMVGITLACAGLFELSSILGKASLLLGIVLLAMSLWKFLQLKPLEGRTALTEQPAVTKLIGVGVVLAGWLVVLFGLHLTPAVGGRMIIAIIGLGISLAGILFILPAACNKNAIWKA